MKKMKSSSSPSADKRVPLRTCIACRTVRAKQELVRVVRTRDNSIDIDLKGKKAGRGAYLCPTAECLAAGLKGNRLEQALHGRLTPESREQIVRLMKGFLEGAS